jgi:hypothetical protein
LEGTDGGIRNVSEPPRPLLIKDAFGDIFSKVASTPPLEEGSKRLSDTGFILVQHVSGDTTISFAGNDGRQTDRNI